MPGERVRLTEEKATLLATLYARALDSRAAAPILGDGFAADAVDRLDVDFRTTKMTPSLARQVAIRAKLIDTWAAEFLAANPEASVAHLGCGLDTRVHRMDPPAGVRWFDVDYPEVIDLRRRLLPERAGYTMIGSSVTEPEYLAEIPDDRPLLVIAEGLVYYLAEGAGPALVKRLTGHAPSGEMIMDALSPLGVRLQRFNKPFQAAEATMHWGIDDPRELEACHPGLRCVTAISAFRMPGRELLTAPSRVTFRLFAHIPVFDRTARFLRYRW